MSAKKHDAGKARVSLTISKADLEIGKVGTMGAAKYGDHNFREANGMKWSRLADAGLRHLIYYLSGDRKDDESGLSHLAHAAWNLKALLEYEINNVGIDDLFKGYNKQEDKDNAAGS